MEIEQLQALPNGARDKYMALQRLFDHPSYKFFLDWAKASAEECTQRLINANNWETHCAQFGAKAAYESLINLENSTEHEFTAIADAALEQLAQDESDKLETEGE
jgi:uncharacterized ferritin-like protein (DUF455 family)